MLVPVTSYVRRRAGSVSSAYVEWGRCGFYQDTARGKTAAQNAGLRFERKVSTALAELYAGFLPQVVLRFNADFVSEKCIADGVLFHAEGLRRGELVVVEVKLRHTADAWFSLRYLYGPVVSKAFPGCQVRLLEVCKNYEMGVKLPEPCRLHRSVEEFIRGSDEFGVVCWR